MNRRAGFSAFTLLEVMVAIAIIGMIAMTLQRFVSTTLTGIQISSDHEVEAEKMAALFRYIDTELDQLPPTGQSLLLGTPHKFGNNLNSDELQWRCVAGSGTLSSAGEGEWFCTLTVMPQPKNPSALDLGLKRRYVDADEKAYDWVPLLKDVAGLKFEYYSTQLNAWLDRWNDQNSRPRLVRMLMWRTKDSLPERAIFTVNSARTQQ